MTYINKRTVDNNICPHKIIVKERSGVNIICGLLLDTVESFTLTADQLVIHCI